jgi:hypothetical protein
MASSVNLLFVLFFDCPQEVMFLRPIFSWYGYLLEDFMGFTNYLWLLV